MAKRVSISEEYLKLDYVVEYKDDLEKAIKSYFEKLCDIYKRYTTGSLFSELKSAFKLIHWIAYGRYWHPKIGKKYDFNEVYQLANFTTYIYKEYR